MIEICKYAISLKAYLTIFWRIMIVYYIVLENVWETAVHLAVAGGVFDGVFLCCPFSH